LRAARDLRRNLRRNVRSYLCRHMRGDLRRNLPAARDMRRDLCRHVPLYLRAGVHARDALQTDV